MKKVQKKQPRSVNLSKNTKKGIIKQTTTHKRRHFHLPAIRKTNQKLIGLTGYKNQIYHLRVGTSKAECEWLNFMEKVFGCKIEREKVILGMPTIGNKREMFVVDGYIPKGNIVMEYNGSRWHGNPKLFNPNAYDAQLRCTYKELYMKTLRRYHVLNSLGYRVFRVWDTDWKKGINGSYWKPGDPV